MSFLVSGLRRLLSSLRSPSGPGLETLIPAEIKNDPFYRTLIEVASWPAVRTILEVGASSGEGSTEALVQGALRNPSRPRLDCLEVSASRFGALGERWTPHSWVHCHHLSSVPLDAFATAEDVSQFYATAHSRFTRFPLKEILRWLEQDLAYVREHRLSSHGIREVKRLAGVDTFDAVLIDGSEFTGEAELAEVYGAGYVMLDDVLTFKNNANYQRLCRDREYSLFSENLRLRNGFAVFVRRSFPRIEPPSA